MNDRTKKLAEESIQLFVDQKAKCDSTGRPVNAEAIERSQRSMVFYGPESSYLNSVEGWCAFPDIRDELLSADDLLSFAPTLHKELKDAVVDASVIKKIAAHRLAEREKEAETFKKLKSVFSTPADEKSVSAPDHARDWIGKVVESVGVPPPQTVGEWRCLTFANLNADKDTHRQVERTPIFLANNKNKKGCVLYLVAERLPGPAIVTPHWWRIGAIPLTDDIVNELHRGFEKVLNSLEDNDRFQVRWWLERDKIGWPSAIAHSTKNAKGDDVPANPSVNVAAACLALALKENVALDQRPILDRFAGVSASLQDAPHGTKLLDWPIGAVGHVEQKCSDAHEAKLDAFVLSDKCKHENANVLVEKKGDHTLSILGRHTLEGAYESLLLSNKKLNDAKANLSISRDNETPADWFAQHICTPTEQSYVEASKQSKED